MNTKALPTKGPWPIRIYEKSHTSSPPGGDEGDGYRYYHIRIADDPHELTGFLTNGMRRALERANVLSDSQDGLHRFALKNAEIVVQRDQLLEALTRTANKLAFLGQRDAEADELLRRARGAP